jgi:putative nucleotidyltransferase with HDIG domain
MSKTLYIPTPADRATQLPAALLGALADRFRHGGVFVLMLRNDGTVAYHDPAAGPFFQRFVLPLVLASEPAGARLADRIDLRELGPGPSAWQVLPGVVLATFPHVEKKQQLGVVMLAAKAPGFDLDEDVLRACGRVGLDAQWLAKQAADLPAYGNDAILHQARLLAAALRDQVRTAGLEAELNSLSEQLANTYEELSLIYQVSSGMKVNRRAGEFFKQACLDVLEVVNVRGIGAALHADLQDRPEPAIYGQLALPPAKIHRLTDSLMAVLRERKCPLLIDDLMADPALSWLGQHAHQLLAVPLQRQEQVLGCLFVLDKIGGDFDSVDSKLLNSIANEAAIYLENAILFQDVHGLMMGLLHSLTSAVDAKDAYTCGHSERVALLSRQLAQQIGLTDAEVEQIYTAGLLHDVGKIGVPETVLQKTGKLTPEEFEQMKKHPEIGARILADVKQLKHILPGVLYHHERYDGRGYPTGLAGRNIPLMGRIICLADCFDAMTSNRTYRKALPLQVAMTEIRRCAGTQFDPLLAEAFLRTNPEALQELLRDHQEKSKRLLELQETLRTAN